MCRYDSACVCRRICIMCLYSWSWWYYTTLSSATTPSQSGAGSDSNEGVHRIPESSGITEASPSDCLVSYAGHSLGEYYFSAKLVYSAAPDNRVIFFFCIFLEDFLSVFSSVFFGGGCVFCFVVFFYSFVPFVFFLFFFFFFFSSFRHFSRHHFLFFYFS